MKICWRYGMLLLLLGCCIIADGQIADSFNFKCKTYTTKDGLAHNFTTKCRMDSKGFLWIITQNGLSRFDGYQFTNFQNNITDSTSLPFNELLDIAVDANDRIWLCYRNGLCYYDQAKHAFTKLKQTAVSLCYDSTGDKIWFTNANGLFAINLQTLTMEQSRLQFNFASNPAYINIDSKQRLWISIERKGYYVYDIKTATYRYYENHYWPRNIVEDDEKNTWICTWQSGFQLFSETAAGNHLAVYDLPGNTGSGYIYQDATQSFPLTGRDIIWVATNTAGIALFDKKQRRFVKWMQYDPSLKSGIATNFNSSIYTDKNGIIWICSWKGLTKINRQEQQFQSGELPFLKSLSDYNLLSSIIDDPYNKNYCWIGAAGSGLCYYDKTKETPVKWYYRNEPGKGYAENYNWAWITNGLKDRNNVLWYSTYGGLVKIDRGKVSNVSLQYNNRLAYSIKVKQLSDSFLWVCTSAGLIRFNPLTGAYDMFRITDKKNEPEVLQDIEALNSNEMLCGYESIGLYIFNKRTGTFKKLPVTPPGEGAKEWLNFTSLVKTGHSILAGSASGLAAYAIGTGEITFPGKEQGIYKADRNSLITDEQQNVWIYTLHGLFKYNAQKKEFKKFTSSDGIYDNSTDPIQLFSYNGNIYIGYRMAYTRFNPVQADVNSSVVKPYITSVGINGKTVIAEPQNLITYPNRLSSNDNNLQFDFTAIDYTNSEKITFTCLLEGFDKTWSQPSGARRKSYTNLPPGNYTFRVKAFNSNNIEGKSIAAFSFSIQPPFYKSWWFILLSTLLASAGLFSVYRLRINQLKRKQQEQNKIQKLELEQYKQQLEFEQIINFFSGSLADKNTKEEVIWDVARNLIHKLGFANCMIYLWNDNKTILLQKAGYGPNGSLENVIKEPFNVLPWQGIVGHVAATKKPIMLGDTSKDPRYRPDVLTRFSELCVPALYNGELISVIDSEDYAKDYYTPQHLQILTTIATLMAARLVSIETATDMQRKKEELHKINDEMAQLELASLRSQMNPHFIFNSLNSVQKYIWENKEEDAAEYLAKFARLMRAILENSKKDGIPLKEEMEVLKIYTELEHRRSNGRFDYTIRIDEMIDMEKTSIPPMILQPFIENAVWHGLNKKAGKGNLSISISAKENQLICIVDDDGVGRNYETAKTTTQKSMGISITQQRINRLSEITKRQASINIVDKMEDGKPAGTTVIISLPLQTI